MFWFPTICGGVDTSRVISQPTQQPAQPVGTGAESAPPGSRVREVGFTGASEFDRGVAGLSESQQTNLIN